MATATARPRYRARVAPRRSSRLTGVRWDRIGRVALVLVLIPAFIRGGAPSTPPGWGGDVTAVVIGGLIAAALARFHLYLFGVAVIG